MKKFYSILFALLAIVGVANADDVVKAGVKYDITKTANVDIEYDTEEVIPDGKAVVVFYYTTDPSHPFLFGPKWTDPKYKNETGFVRQWADKNHRSYSKNPNGTEHLDLCGNVTAGEYWCYTICDEADIETVKSPLEAGGEEAGGGSSMEKGEYAGGTGSKSSPYVITKDKYYEIIGSGQDGYVDEQYFKHEATTTSQYIVVFYIDPEGGKIYNPFLNQADKSYSKYNAEGTLGTVTEADGSTWSRFYKQSSGDADLIQIYQPSTPKGIWCYTIVDSESEAQTVANPYFATSGEGGGDVPQVVPGQDIENAIVLTKDNAATFSTKNKTLYVKFVAENSGTVTMNLDNESTRARWMEDGVMAYGAMRQNMFTNGNQFNVEKGHTYYCQYQFADELKDASISYSLEAAEQGAARGEAILIEADGHYDLLGVPSVQVEGGTNYTNKTTWFKLEKEGTLDGKNLMSVKIGGNNTTEVALYQNDEKDAIKSYAMGDGSGMLAKNSTVTFDIDLAANDYYIAITQDDVNGTADFTFTVSTAGQTFGTAIDAVAGENTAAAGTKYYKYTHAGDVKWMKITGSVIKALYNEDQKEILNSDDFAEGTEIYDGTVVYFQANGNFSINLTEVEQGRIPSLPVTITDETGATFNLNGNSSDTRRYMQYTAGDEGTFIYATQNANVIETASSATVRDVTDAENPKTITIVQEESDEFGETYFIYKWPVLAGHTYAIEQNLGNNFGAVEFLTMFTPAMEGETAGKAFPIALYEAKNLGRTKNTPNYYKFVAEEAGDYTVSVQMTGYVKSYDADLKATSIPKSYSDGLEYHNETFTLAAGEALIFSCEASQDIEHELASGINDEFIPNYYATVTKADETGGLDYTQPMAIELDDETSIDAANVWHGAIAVPAGETLYVVANTSADVNAIYFAAPDQYGQLQWVNKSADLSVEKADGKQIYTLKATNADRNVQIMSYGMECTGTFTASFNDPYYVPAPDLTLTITPEIVFNPETKEVTISFTVPATYDESEVPVENLNLVALKIENWDIQKSMEIAASTGEGAYNAGDVFSITNKIDFDINEGDFINVELDTWGQDNITIQTNLICYEEPIDDNAYYLVVTINGKLNYVKVSPDTKIEWKKGAELK